MNCKAQIRGRRGRAVPHLWFGLIATSAILIPGLLAVSPAEAGPVPSRADVPRLEAVSCPSKSVCFAVGRRVLFRTSNGGKTWESLDTPDLGAFGAMAAVTCPSARTCEIVGDGTDDDGAIWGSTDGGANWNLQLTAIAGGFFLAISCPSVTVCEAAGNEDAIFGTLNGGSSWQQQSVPPGIESVSAFSCPSTTTCDAVGDIGGGSRVVRTVDGGMRWGCSKRHSRRRNFSSRASPARQ